VCPQELKFIADAMLGRLAKWLRLMGYDTMYDPTAEDRDLVRCARAEGRILLTRDRELAKRKGLSYVLIESDRLDEQLAQLFRELGISHDRLSPRCARCNTLLRPISRAEVRARVPPYVFSRHWEFSLCPRCDRVYWKGTHWERMRRKLEDIQERAATPS
jgi:uncharacterized protein with PIN domain